MNEDDWLRFRTKNRHPDACTCAGCERVRRQRFGLDPRPHPEDTGRLASVHRPTCRCRGTGRRDCTKCGGLSKYQYKKPGLFSRTKTLPCPHCANGKVGCQDPQ